MISLRSKSNQSGNFSVEFAIVGVFFSLLLAFSGDLVIKLAVKGKLERMAYSAATVVAERTQLFDEDYTVTSTDGRDSANIVKKSLVRTLGSFNSDNFGYSLDTFTYTDSSKLTKTLVYSEGLSCSVAEPDSSMLVSSSWGRTLTFYQVTLCYKTTDWFGSVIGALDTYNLVSTRALAIGR